MKVKAIQVLEPEHGLPILLKVAGMARSTYFYQCRTLKRQDKYHQIRRRLHELHELHKGRYGYRRLTATLKTEGICLNHKTVRKLMQEEKIECRIRRKRKVFRPSPELAASPNLLNRDFKADTPFKKGVTDVTEFKVGAQKVYISALLDLYDGAVISIVYSLHNNTNLIMSMYEALRPAQKERLEGMLIHSDQGVLYRSWRYHDFMKRNHITQSMSRRGNCYDNALVESFFGTFKTETIKLRPIKSLEQLSQEIKAYAEYYNKKRIKSTLGYRSPYQYRLDNGFGEFC